MLILGCARPNAPTPEPAYAYREPIVEVRGSPVGSACVSPNGWNCYEHVTRAEVLEAIATADLARAVQKPKPPPERWLAERQRPRNYKAERDAEVSELARRAGLDEEEAALSQLRKYVACHPEDRELAFELARRNFELNRFAEAAYTFFQIGEGPAEDDLVVEALMRGLESVNVLGSQFALTECFDEMEERVPKHVDRLCSVAMVGDHPARTDNCRALAQIHIDLIRLSFSCRVH